MLAWIVGRGVCVIPKSNSTERIKENSDIFFSLTIEEDKRIGNLMGAQGELAVRNLDGKDYVGFDIYDEDNDQPI